MIEFHLDTRSGVAPYLQIAQQVRHALRAGTLQADDQLPTVREVVGKLAINPNTVLKAYRELEREGLVAGRPGQGTLAVGLLTPTTGRIEVLGSAPGRERAVLERVGFVAQNTPLYDGFAVEEMLTLGRRLNRRWDAEWAEERLRALGIPLEKRVGARS